MNEPTIKIILVPVDFSEITMSVVENAVYFARLLSARLLLLHVVHVPPFAEASTWLDPVVSPSVEHDITSQMKRTAEANLKKLAEECGNEEGSAEALVREGVPFNEILKCAEERGVDMIILGSHGRTGISYLLMGSVASRVVHRARCSVLCIKSKGEAASSQ